MPLIDSNLASNWDGTLGTSLYVAWNGDNPPTYSGYLRQNMKNFLGPDADKLVTALISIGMTPGQLIALVGAGFGWEAETFLARGFGPMTDGTSNGRLCAIDASQWIQSNLNGNAVVQILNSDINSSVGRNAIKNAFNLKGNATVDWCVTMDVLPLLAGTDPTVNNEITPFCSNCRQLSTKVAHWISPLIPGGTQDQRLNWKTLADWKTNWVAPDFVIGRGQSVVA